MERTRIGSTFPRRDYREMFQWEKFDYRSWQKWMEHNWTYSVYFTVIYVAAVLAGRICMKNRPAFKLRKELIAWNVALAAFSIIGFIRGVPELIQLLQEPNGFHASCCRRDRMTVLTFFWNLVMTLSKVVELGDTLFIVLRKQPLIFLHWYHHFTVMLYCWYTWSDGEPGHRWFMPMNFFVHSIMYSYYALRAMGIKLPRAMSMVITSLQILQMIVGVTVNVYALYAKSMGLKCESKIVNVYLALGMYATYFILFANFFMKTYVQKKPKKKSS